MRRNLIGGWVVAVVLLAAFGSAAVADTRQDRLSGDLRAPQHASASVASQRGSAYDDAMVMPDLREVPATDGAQTPPPEPETYRTDGYRTPVPATLAGAKVITGPEAVTLWKARTAIFLDVYPRPPKPDNLPPGTIWRDHPHQTIEDAVWLPNVGYGKLSSAVDAEYQRNLTALTKGDKSAALVFFCLRNCWMSWNAAKRAMTYGYRNVIWFPDGTDAWQELGQLMLDAQPYGFKTRN